MSGFEFAGEATAPIPLVNLRGRKRFQSLLKCADWMPIRAVYSALLDSKPPA